MLCVRVGVVKDSILIEVDNHQELTEGDHHYITVGCVEKIKHR